MPKQSPRNLYVFVMALASAIGAALADPAAQQPNQLPKYMSETRPTCGSGSNVVSANRPPLNPSEVKGVSKRMTMSEIIDKLGPANRDVGSGVWIFEWDTTDGRVLYMYSTHETLCEPPMDLSLRARTSPISKGEATWIALGAAGCRDGTDCIPKGYFSHGTWIFTITFVDSRDTSGKPLVKPGGWMGITLDSRGKVLERVPGD